MTTKLCHRLFALVVTLFCMDVFDWLIDRCVMEADWLACSLLGSSKVIVLRLRNSDSKIYHLEKTVSYDRVRVCMYPYTRHAYALAFVRVYVEFVYILYLYGSYLNEGFAPPNLFHFYFTSIN